MSSFKIRLKRNSTSKVEQEKLFISEEENKIRGHWQVQSMSEGMVEPEEDRRLGRSAKISKEIERITRLRVRRLKIKDKMF